MSENDKVRYFIADATGSVVDEGSGRGYRYARGLKVEAGDPREDSACAYEVASRVASAMAERGISNYSLRVAGPDYEQPKYKEVKEIF